MRKRMIVGCLFFALLLPAQGMSQVLETYEYDALGRVVRVDDGRGYTARYDLDDAGNRENLSRHNQFAQTWEAESLPKVIGSDVGGARQAVPADGAGHMSYGPYTTAIAVGNRVATWRVKLTDVDPTDPTTVLTIDVYDSTASTHLAVLSIPKSHFLVGGVYQVIELPFVLPSGSAGNAIEMRSYAHGLETIAIDKIGIY